MKRYLPLLLTLAVSYVLTHLFPHDAGIIAAKGVASFFNPFTPLGLDPLGINDRGSSNKGGSASAPAPAAAPASAAPAPSIDQSQPRVKKPGLESTVLTSPLGTEDTQNDQKKKRTLLGVE